ncbi:acyltransferase family protein [Streptomyces sp. NPDC003006]
MASSPPVTFARLPSLTGLRFVAAFGVFVCHVTFLETARRGGSPSPFLFLLGPVGVSLFFVLSGFVLTCSARKTDTARAFWRRRIVKIYPNHLVVWACFMVLMRGVGLPRTTVDSMAAPTVLGDLANALLVSSLIPLPQIALAGNAVTWSLTCELLFYLLFPVLLPLVKKVRRERLPVAVAASVAAVWAVPLVSLGFGGPLVAQGYLPGDITGPQMLFVYMFPPCRVPEFLLGMFLARMHMSGFTVRVGAVQAACLLCAALYIGIVVLPSPFLLAAVTVAPVALLVRAVAALDISGGASPLRLPGMVLLGEVSYAFYLLHATVIAAVLHYSAGTWGLGWTACVSLTLALTGSWLLYTLVERPCVHRFSSGRRHADTVRPVAADAAGKGG